MIRRGGVFLLVLIQLIIVDPFQGFAQRVVTLEEAQLPGAVLKAVPYGHTSILFRRGAMEEVAHFLEHGRFLP